jgi:hypothetical protein
MQIHICLVRGFQRFRGDMKFPVATVFGNMVISLVLGSVFYDLPPTAEYMNSRNVLLFFAILFNALSSAVEVRFLSVTEAYFAPASTDLGRFSHFIRNDRSLRNIQDMHFTIRSPKRFRQ